MSQPLLDLRSMLTSRHGVTGRVIAVSGGTVRVTTPRGVMEAIGSGLRVGDRVMVRDGGAERLNAVEGTGVHWV